MRALLIRLQVNWFRNLLAVIQVGLAVAVVTAVLASILPAIRSGSENEDLLFQVRYGAVEHAGLSFSMVFYLEDVDYLEEMADTIEGASIMQNESFAVVRVGDERYAIAGVVHASPSYARLRGLEIISGTFFTQEDVPDLTPQVAVISDRLAEILFGENQPIGKTINLRPQEERNVLVGLTPTSMNLDLQFIQAQPGTDLTIIGVFKADDTLGFNAEAEHLILPAARNRQVLRIPAPPPQLSEPGHVVIVGNLPQPALQRLTYGTLLVKPRPGMERQAEEEIRSLLERRLEGRPEAQRFAGGDYAIMFDQATNLSAVLREARLRQGVITGALALAALIVAGFAVLTTTMANLTQRVRTIGLARSIGATRSDILREVVLEAALLSGIGGTLGICIAYPINQVLLEPLRSTLLQGQITVTNILTAGILGLLSAVAIGAVAAVVPGWTVARLAPAEAWREGTV